MTKTPTFLVNSEVEGLRKERARHPDSQAADVAFRADSSTLSRALWEQERELFNVKQFLGSPSRTGWVVGHSVEAEHRTPVCCHKSMGRDLSAGRCWRVRASPGSIQPDQTKVLLRLYFPLCPLIISASCCYYSLVQGATEPCRKKK